MHKTQDPILLLERATLMNHLGLGVYARKPYMYWQFRLIPRKYQACKIKKISQYPCIFIYFICVYFCTYHGMWSYYSRWCETCLLFLLVSVEAKYLIHLRLLVYMFIMSLLRKIDFAISLLIDFLHESVSVILSISND